MSDKPKSFRKGDWISHFQYGVGQVLGVLKPDSQGPDRLGQHDFPMLDQFEDIMIHNGS